ncbi:MAG: metallophosphoesterase, partial [Candidatus Cloacimonetes bacterium]|nr:metallophosphoesterase [Candidatus Cloacimonadota bacterium]
MKKYFVLIFSLISLISAAQTSIYDIQYTQVPGSDGYYPSPLAEQYVTTGGIVSGINFDTDHYFISSSNGGAWNGIYIYDDTHFPAVGDSIILSGQVWEYHGLTEIRDVSSFETISSNNPLSPVSVSTDEINNQEAFESVFVTVTDISVSSQYNEWSEWQIDDGSGECFIGIGFLDLEGMSFPLVLDYPFDSISGIVSYSWGNFLLNPRNEGDIDPVAEGYLLSLNSNDIYDNSGFEVPVLLSSLEESVEINSYQLDFQYDPGVVSYFGFEENGTLSETGLISEQLNGNEVTLNFSGNFSFIGVEQLIKLNFNPLNSGDAGIDLISANLNEIEVNFFSVEQINIILENDPIGDTLTVIQRPLLNIPSIVTPGEDLEIICLAPETTSNWNAELIHNNKTISLNNIQAEFDPNLQRWFLSAVIPEPEIYELYDLRITASGNIEDVTANAVGILPEIKDEYYFVHITDTHLPTHYFYPDEESLTDTSEIVDLREVIKDINLIKPEFVLLTGDLVNEGELEDFENRRCFTKAQRLLEELEVPLYLVAGNHDLGGWNDTPPPQGTSRRNWWRFFGWNWLSDPPDSDPYYTQNYSFDYGPVHFTGLESYLNYDYFMYNIYGYESFTSSQLDWLENDLQNASDSESKVLFYHMDFSDQIDLSELGVDMSLWGHIHSDSGNINSHPYNLATENTCDGDRAYRLIKVSDAELDPQYTSHAGWDGNN